MKKVLLLLFCVLFSSGSNLIFADDGDDNKKIDFVESEELSEDNPRMLIPVRGYYSLENICLQFYADLGMVEITVVNQTTGVTQSTMFDSVLGQAVMAISNASGIYLIYIETENGTTYWGTFQL